MDAVKSATEAIALARQAAMSSGVLFSVVSSAEKVGDVWVVKVGSFGSQYEATIAATSGLVTSWKQVK